MKVKRLREIWKDILGYEGYYQISNLGRVRSLDREVNCNGGKCLRKGVLLKPGKRGGYLKVDLCKLGKAKTIKIHRLVLETFKGPCPEGMEACHKNGIKTYNTIYNLRWDTQIANCIDKKRHGTNYEGEKHWNVKLTENDIVEIRIEYAKGNITQRELGKRFGVSDVMISYIILRKNWKHI